MKILFVFHNVYFFRYFDGVVRRLHASGHDVILSAGMRTMSKGYTDRAFRRCIEETGCREEPLMLSGKAAMVGAMLRDIIGYSNFFRAGHPSPAWGLKWKNYLPKSVRSLLDMPLVNGLLRWERFRKLLRVIEGLLFPEPRVMDRLKKDRPDVVVACPFIWTLSADADYIKAATRLKIPTVVAVGSWDHLAGKGLFPLMPDLTLVWNEEMAREAMELQDVPAEGIVMTGAPPFDFWFSARPEQESKSFHLQVGLDVEKPYVIFLCSSKPIAGLDEPRVIREFVHALHSKESTKDLQILIRPYPSLADSWLGWVLPGTRVWPKEGEWPDMDDAKQNLFDTIYHSVAVIGINTTAMLEAVVAGKPCMAIMTNEFKGSQAERAHFQQLLRGGFLEIAGNYQEAQQILENLLAGIDSKMQARKTFVERFFRPHGVEHPAALLAANAIEMIANGKTAQQVRSHLVQ